MSITSVVDFAIGKIGELLVEEVKLLHGVEGQVRNLQEELVTMRSYLNVIEDMDVEGGGNALSRGIIKQVRKIAYDAEDVIESYILEASSSTDKTKEDSFRRVLRLPRSLLRNHQVGSEIESITERLNKTIERWRKYAGGNEMLGAHARLELSKKIRPLNTRPPAYSHTQEEYVVGLKEDIKTLVGVLTHEDHPKINFVSVVGMGGSGKTTLARNLYNHERVKKHFDCVAWVSVSQQWNAQQIILDLLKKVKGYTMGIGESSFSHQVLVGELHEYLEMKSYLIVLDDVWESEALAHICGAIPFPGDKRKIIVTTRNKEVVKCPTLRPHTCFHEPRPLTDEESWDLFSKIAFIHREDVSDSTVSTKLEELGKEMLKKCRGLPLAVIALAGILCDKENMEEWERISKVVSSRIREQGRGTLSYGPVKDMLALIYIDLPHDLKPCFLYLAQYREDESIHVRKLISQWIAEGFITPRGGWTLEDVARQYLDDLVHRCLVLVGKRNYEGKVKMIQMHDLVRDLCIEKAKEEDFFETFIPKAPHSNTTMIEPRRAAFYIPTSFDEPIETAKLAWRNVVLPSRYTNSQHLRSLFFRGNDRWYLRGGPEFYFDRDPNLGMQAVYRNFSLLRVLVVERVRTFSNDSLPTGIGSLIHLRYLRLWGTVITKLPSSIGNLRNLLTLDWTRSCLPLYNIPDVISIPDVLWKLERLRHLYIPRGDHLDVETLKLHTLKSLQTLDMGVGGGNSILEEVPRLSTTIQKLTIHDIGSQELLEAAFGCPSIRSNCLRSLCLSWKDELALQTYTNLEEPIGLGQHLRKLYLEGRMPRVGILFPTSITKLRLLRTGFEAEAALVPLGKLPHLTVMELNENAYKGKRWTWRAGEFPQLKKLNVFGLHSWEEWSVERGTMPQLKKLKIAFCEKLRQLPEGLKFITTLQHLKAVAMGDEFKERTKAGGIDAHIIQDVPHVDI